jgi:predicted metal-dependent peptidase
MARKRGGGGEPDPATLAYLAGMDRVRTHPLFAPLAHRAFFYRRDTGECPPDGWAVVHEGGTVILHPTRRADPEEWAYVAAHALLHLGFEHFKPERLQQWREWTAACDCFVARFLADLKFGRAPEGTGSPAGLPARTEAELFAAFVERGIPPELAHFGTAGGASDMIPARAGPRPGRRWSWMGSEPEPWGTLLDRGLAEAVRSAVRVAAGRESALGSGGGGKLTAAQAAREWFIHGYPLLGALAASFTVIEDAELCRRLDISIAAVDDAAQEIYMNPFAGLGEEECRFVMAHELLHAGLRHQARRQGRDPWLWNVACDYVVNQWLVEMGIGQVPQIGVLLDADLKGLSAEAIYDRIVTDLRRYRKLATLRGVGLGDMLEGRPGAMAGGQGVTLDELYRNALSQGLYAHQEGGRGFLPAGLVEEIRALHMPAIPWEVELARWFDERFAPLERYRTFARPSRRQASTPNIPRPRWAVRPESMADRTFGVVLDTSGSMGRELLGKALGTIASYAIARDVPAVRVVFCDAAAHDAGYMAPEEIAGRVRVRGRGGTVLQPGVDLLEDADDFPADGPILLITDAQCDRVRIRRDHGILIPAGARLPFVPVGPVFRLR